MIFRKDIGFLKDSAFCCNKVAFGRMTPSGRVPDILLHSRNERSKCVIFTIEFPF